MKESIRGFFQGIVDISYILFVIITWTAAVHYLAFSGYDRLSLILFISGLIGGPIFFFIDASNPSINDKTKPKPKSKKA